MNATHRGTNKTVEDMSVADYAAAGVITGFGCAMVESPIDFFKSQLQTQVLWTLLDVSLIPITECMKWYDIRSGKRSQCSVRYRKHLK
jgi:hypothetical protein